MLDENYNRILDIHILDVEECNSLVVLSEWENVLLKKSKELKSRISVKNKEISHCKNVSEKNNMLAIMDLSANILFFSRLIHNRIRKVKSQKKFNQNIYFNMLKNFKDIMKQKLPVEEYEAVKAEAYKMAEKQSEVKD